MVIQGRNHLTHPHTHTQVGINLFTHTHFLGEKFKTSIRGSSECRYPLGWLKLQSLNKEPIIGIINLIIIRGQVERRVQKRKKVDSSMEVVNPKRAKMVRKKSGRQDAYPKS